MEAAALLQSLFGYDGDSWDAYEATEATDVRWSELSSSQRAAAQLLGYYEQAAPTYRRQAVGLVLRLTCRRLRL